MRLNRYLAQCGVASRRNAEKLIAARKVTVNGVVATSPALQIDLESDRVEVDGRAVSIPTEHQYLMLHKPAGYDVTRGDPFAERIVFELLPKDLPGSVQAVGRLDRDTTGLLLFTNDGDLAFRIIHPRFLLEKEYIAAGEQAPTPEQAQRLVAGVELEDGPAQAIRAEACSATELAEFGLEAPAGGLRIVMHQGRKRIVRRLCTAIDFPLTQLHRSRIGPLELGDLGQGKFRELTEREVQLLRDAVGLAGETE